MRISAKLHRNLFVSFVTHSDHLYCTCMAERNKMGIRANISGQTLHRRNVFGEHRENNVNDNYSSCISAHLDITRLLYRTREREHKNITRTSVLFFFFWFYYVFIVATNEDVVL